MTVGEFYEIVGKLCALHNCSQTSGFRTVKRNQLVGGKPNSCHVLDNGGMAADLVPDDNTAHNRELLVMAAHANGLQALDETDHVHVQFRLTK